MIQSLNSEEVKAIEKTLLITYNDVGFKLDNIPCLNIQKDSLKMKFFGIFGLKYIEQQLNDYIDKKIKETITYLYELKFFTKFLKAVIYAN